MFLLVLFFALLLAGGGSRADIVGQAIVRIAAAVSIAGVLLLGPTLALRDLRPILVLLLAILATVLLQLIPLPPGVWQSLPGRALFQEAVTGTQPWRPLSIVPDATLNAAGSLLIPLATLLLVGGLKPEERAWLPPLLLLLVASSTLVGVLQLSGSGFDNPFINDDPNKLSGSFANRNHFALFVALGCLIAPLWPFLDTERTRWRGPVALSSAVLFLLAILASGSRAGLLLGALALVIGLVLARDGLQRTLRKAPRWVPAALLGVVVATLAGFVAVSLYADRAQAISRVLELDASADVRAKALPIVIELVKLYLPVGTGFGTFDSVFRIHEPFDMLTQSYLNRAHNDFVEVALDGGLPGLILLIAAVGWWGVATFRVWRCAPSRVVTLGRTGSAMLLLIMLASTVDYPARTPMIMTVIVVAAAWLSWGKQAAERPGRD